MAKVLIIDDEHVYCDNLRLFLVLEKPFSLQEIADAVSRARSDGSSGKD